MAEKSGQPRLVVDAHAFARGAAFGFGGRDRDGTVSQPGRPRRAHQPTPGQRADQPGASCRRRCAPAHVEVPSRNMSRNGRSPLIAIGDYELLAAVGSPSAARRRSSFSARPMPASDQHSTSATRQPRPDGLHLGARGPAGGTISMLVAWPTYAVSRYGAAPRPRRRERGRAADRGWRDPGGSCGSGIRRGGRCGRSA